VEGLGILISRLQQCSARRENMPYSPGAAFKARAMVQPGCAGCRTGLPFAGYTVLARGVVPLRSPPVATAPRSWLGIALEAQGLPLKRAFASIEPCCRTGMRT